MKTKHKNRITSLRANLHEIIFEADTKVGKTFDIILLISIMISVVIVMLESIQSVKASFGSILIAIEWFFTLLFTIEYLLRLFSVGKPIKYATSFYGIIDLMAILPTYISLFVGGTQHLLIIRLLRLLRVFRILKLKNYLGEAKLLMLALRASRPKISVFLYAVVMVVIISGSLMYAVEGDQHGFTSIPQSIYWAVVTLTTVGYGDMAPQTELGQALASIIMIMGYGIIAVPTGIVTIEMSNAYNKNVSTQACPQCSAEGHDPDALYCKYCGDLL